MWIILKWPSVDFWCRQHTLIQSGGSIHAINLLTSGLFTGQCHVVLLKCSEQNGNIQTLTQVSQLYVHVSFCLKVIRSWLNMPTGGHAYVICMCVTGWKKNDEVKKTETMEWLDRLLYPLRAYPLNVICADASHDSHYTDRHYIFLPLCYPATTIKCNCSGIGQDWLPATIRSVRLIFGILLGLCKY